jgi:hypothetical protein
MTCGVYRSALMELARGGVAAPELKRHLERCAGCGRFLEDQVALTAMFGDVALRDVATIATPPELEAHLLAEFDAFNAPVRPTVLPRKILSVKTARRWVPVSAGAIAAGLAIAWFVAPKHVATPAPAPVKARISRPTPEVAEVHAAPVRPKPVRRRKTGVQAAKPVAEPEAPFVEIPYTIPLAPYERASIMRMEMPVAALIAAGLPVRTANTDGRAQADVVVGEDGRAHAVRVISISSNYSQRGNHQ